MASIPDSPDDLVAYGRGRKFWRAVDRDHLLRADEIELRQVREQLRKTLAGLNLPDEPA